MLQGQCAVALARVPAPQQATEAGILGPTRHLTQKLNYHRPLGALGWNTPASTLRDNLPGTHN